MNIYHITYTAKYRRNGNVITGISAIIVANSQEEAEERYRKNHKESLEYRLRTSLIGNTDTASEIWSY